MIELYASSVLARSFPLLKIVMWATMFPKYLPMSNDINAHGDSEASVIIWEHVDGAEIVTSRASERAKAGVAEYHIQRL